MKILFLGDTQHPNSQNWIDAFEKYGGCEVIPWSLPWPNGFWGKINRILTWIIAPIIIRIIIKNKKPDIVIGYRLTSYGFIAALSGHKNIVLAAQGNSDVISPIEKSYLNAIIKKKLAIFAVKKASLIHAWAQNMADNIYTLGASKDKVLIMHRGIDLANFTTKNEKKYESLNIIVTRALYPEYKHDIIIKAVKKVIDNNIPIKLKIIGIGKEEHNLKILVENLGIQSQIKFYGKLNNTDLKKELEESNIYVSMPTTEGVSASLMEAMACYCIPIVSDIAPNRIWINNNINGFLVQLDNIEELAEKIEFIWNNKNNYKQLLTDNRKLVEDKSSQEKNIRVFVEKYNKIINLCAE